MIIFSNTHLTMVNIRFHRLHCISSIVTKAVLPELISQWKQVHVNSMVLCIRLEGVRAFSVIQRTSCDHLWPKCNGNLMCVWCVLSKLIYVLCHYQMKCKHCSRCTLYVILCWYFTNILHIRVYACAYVQWSSYMHIDYITIVLYKCHATINIAAGL